MARFKIHSTKLDSGKKSKPVIELRGRVKSIGRQADPVEVGLLDPALPLGVGTLFLVGLEPLVDLEASVVHGHPVQVGGDTGRRG